MALITSCIGSSLTVRTRSREKTRSSLGAVGVRSPLLEYHPVSVLGQGLAPLSLLLPGGYSCRSSESISQSHVREDDVARACRGVEASAQRQLVDLARGQNEDTETSGQLEVCVDPVGGEAEHRPSIWVIRPAGRHPAVPSEIERERERVTPQVGNRVC